MPTLTKPPVRPLPSAPRQDFDLEALIKEARRRQRKRQTLVAAVVVAVAAIIWLVVRGVGGGNAASLGASGNAATADRSTATPFAVGVSFRDPKRAAVDPFPAPGSGLVIVDPNNLSCTRVPLPKFGGDLVFADRRYAYAEVSEFRPVHAVWVGVVGRGQPHRSVLPRQTRAPWTLLWVDHHLALAESRNPPRLRVAGRTIRLPVPRGASLGFDVAASHGRIAYDVSWRNQWDIGAGRAALFVYADGTTKEVRRIRVHDPQGSGQMSPTWSPDGRSIAFVEHGDLWTMRPDGRARRLTFTPKLDESSPLWAADGKTIAYQVFAGRRFDVYSVPARGGEPTQLTHTSASHSAPGAAAGYWPLAWVGRTALAVSYFDTTDSANSVSLGVVDVTDGTISDVCTLPNASVVGATALG